MQQGTPQKTTTQVETIRAETIQATTSQGAIPLPRPPASSLMGKTLPFPPALPGTKTAQRLLKVLSPPIREIFIFAPISTS